MSQRTKFNFYTNWVWGLGFGYWKDTYDADTFDAKTDTGENVHINDTHHFMFLCWIFSFGGLTITGGDD